MYSMSGLVDGNLIRTQESLLAYEGCHVIVTILDYPAEALPNAEHNISEAGRKAAARELAGMWLTHDNYETVDDMVRNLRREREFDY